MGSFRLGSILGIEIRIDYSWFILFFLLLWTFSQGVFPQEFPGQGAGVYIGMGLVTTLLFFASLLTHEMSHSLVARRRGIDVEGITLFIFGGMARTSMEARRAGDEFVIAVVGPLASLALAVLFGAIWWLGSRAGVGPFVLGVSAYLGFINLMLALFNLLPGFPLDGGRLLRSGVWKATGNPVRATRVASVGGTVLAFLLMAFGIWQIFHGLLLDGVWLILIGWFLRNAARASWQQFELTQRLEAVPVWQAMSLWPETVPPELTLDRLAAGRLTGARPPAYPVVGADGRVLGTIGQEQVRAVPFDDWPRTTAAAVMVPLTPDQLVDHDQSLGSLVDRLRPDMAPLLVTREGRLEGVITANDLARWLQRSRATRT